jgi:hypothetical protein
VCVFFLQQYNTIKPHKVTPNAKQFNAIENGKEKYLYKQPYIAAAIPHGYNRKTFEVSAKLTPYNNYRMNLVFCVSWGMRELYSVTALERKYSEY